MYLCKGGEGGGKALLAFMCVCVCVVVWVVVVPNTVWKRCFDVRVGGYFVEVRCGSNAPPFTHPPCLRMTS